MAFFVCRVCPWITVAVFLAGLFVQMRRWGRGGRPNLTLFPSGGSDMDRCWTILREVLAFEALFKSNRSLWIGTWVFHAGLLIVLAGHARIVAEFPRLRAALGVTPAVADSMGAWIGGVAGSVVLAMGAYLLARRVWVRSVREISTVEDYFVLGLLLAVIASGDALRCLGGCDLGQTRAFFSGLVLLQPVQAPAHPLFLVHFLLAQVLVMLVPFSKFLHIPGVFVAKALLLAR